ncbi:MAG: translation initiation factor IF-2 N-terminal domain-containing protein, partial [Rikenellaceae bacterium]|nr:translation initiation factor IF-2 N-terminal domain-containing protein [Rikenellaceae bacterium]
MSERKIRLSQVMKEFNVGLTTVVEFLQKRGVEIDSAPNALVLPEVYAILEKEYGAGRTADSRQPIRERINTKPESVTLKKKRDADEEEKEVFIKTTVEEKISGPKVLGKIDLNAPAKKPAEAKPVAAPVVESPKPQPAPQPKVEVKVEEKKPAAPVAEAPKDEPKKESEIQSKTYDERMAERTDNVFRASDDNRLSGPKVLGKIDVSAMSSDSGYGRKREKRKRITKDKVDVSRPQQPAAAPKPQQGGGANQQGGGANQNPYAKKDKKNKKAAPAPKPVVRPEVSDEEVQRQVKDTLARLTSKGAKTKGAKYRKEKREEAAMRMNEAMEREQAESKILKVTEFVTVSDLATMMSVPVTGVITACMNLGLMVSINQRLDAEALAVVA